MTDPSAPATQPEASPARPGDPFPRERFLSLVGHLPRYLRLALGLAGEPRLARSRKAGVLAAAAYLASPIDAIPGVVPVVGQLDDVAIALLALRAALRSLDPATRSAQLEAAGLSGDDLDRDLAAVAVVAGWLARRGAAVGQRLAILAGTVSAAAVRAGATGIRRGASVVGRAGGRAVRATGATLARAAGHGRRVVGGRLGRGTAPAGRTGDEWGRPQAGTSESPPT